MESLADVQGVVAVLGLDADPETVHGVDVGVGHSLGIADCAPGSALSVDQSVADVHGVVVVASALVSDFSSLVNGGEVSDEINGILTNSITLGSRGDQNVVIGIGGGDEFEEEVGPVGVDSVDSREGGNEVFIGDPHEPAEPDFLSLDSDEKVEGVRAEDLVHVVLDVLSVGSDIVFVKGAGRVGEVDEIGEVGGLDSGAGEVVELEGVLGGGELGLRLWLDES